MKHLCHWPGCQDPVPPKMWGCKPHWFKLPKFLRDRIWKSYVPGQEIRKDPSDEYLAVAKDVQKYLLEVDEVKIKDPLPDCGCGCCEMARKFRAEGDKELGCFCQHGDPGDYAVCGCTYCLEVGRVTH